MKRYFFITLLIIFTFCAALRLDAQVCVSTTGDDITGDGSTGNPYATIQKGIDEAVNRMENSVWISEGRYPEHVIMASGVSLLGGFSPGFGDRDLTLQNYRTRIDGTGNGRCIYGINLNEIIVIEGLIITNGYINEHEEYGAGIGFKRFGNNLEIRNNEIKNNVNADGFGGGIGLFYTIAKISNNNICNNSAGMSGSGIFAYGEGFTTIICGNNIYSNEGRGHGIIYLEEDKYEVYNNNIYGNRGLNVIVFSDIYSGKLYNNKINDNYSYSSWDENSAFFVEAHTSIDIYNNQINNNELNAWDDCAAIYVRRCRVANIYNNEINNNINISSSSDSSKASGALLIGGTINFINNTLVGNNKRVIYLENGNINAINNIIYGGDVGIYKYDCGRWRNVNLTLKNNCIDNINNNYYLYDCKTDSYATSQNALNSLVNIDSSDNIVADPKLDVDNLHLQKASSCIDAGIDPISYIADLIYDVDGDYRPRGTTYDIGADESPYGNTLDIRIFKSSETSMAHLGYKMVYPILVTNIGERLANNVVVVDELHDWLQFDACLVNGVLCDIGNSSIYDSVNHTLTFDTSTVPNSLSDYFKKMDVAEKIEIFVTNTIKPISIIGEYITNKSYVYSKNDDIRPLDNTNEIRNKVAYGKDMMIITTSSPSTACPAGQIDYFIIIGNISPTDIDEVILTDELSDGIVYKSCRVNNIWCDDALVYDSVNHILTFDETTVPASEASKFTILEKFTEIKIRITGTVKEPPEINFDDILQNEAYIASTPDDDNLANNTSIYQTTVICSWDPNEKLVSPQGFISKDQKLTYFIHYENEGNASAKDISITDVLQDNLDGDSIEYMSDNGQYNASNRTLSWKLEDINLPPGETDFVHFLISPVMGLSEGTEIKNKASIVFDSNPPIETPEVVSIIGSPEELKTDKLIDAMYSLYRDIKTTDIPNRNGFAAKVDGAIETATEGLGYLHEGNLEEAHELFNTTINKLNSLLNMISAQTGKKLSAETAADWRARAEFIIEEMGAVIAGEGSRSNEDEEDTLKLKTEIKNNIIKLQGNESAEIVYTSDEPDNVNISVYSMKGDLIKVLVDGNLSSGIYTFQWDGTDKTGRFVSSGLYLIKIKSTKLYETKKVLILK